MIQSQSPSLNPSKVPKWARQKTRSRLIAAPACLRRNEVALIIEHADLDDYRLGRFLTSSEQTHPIRAATRPRTTSRGSWEPLREIPRENGISEAEGSGYATDESG